MSDAPSHDDSPPEATVAAEAPERAEYTEEADGASDGRRSRDDDGGGKEGEVGEVAGERRWESDDGPGWVAYGVASRRVLSAWL
jgi:hypothetical protein